MTTEYGHRFKSGDVCAANGRFEFDGYLDGSSELLPFLEEMEVALKPGHVFPLISDRSKACYWSNTNEVETVDETVAGAATVNW